jgi:2',3'-cyclic-nucleotide 2'-phosphodiesterase (5'-nucleotidase family)
MGQVLADALRLRMKADVALCITGHLHEGLRRGPITLGNLFGITSSPANPALADLTGAQIIRALEYGADPIVWQQSPRTLRGTQIGLLQVSGITYQLDKFLPCVGCTRPGPAD